MSCSRHIKHSRYQFWNRFNQWRNCGINWNMRMLGQRTM